MVSREATKQDYGKISQLYKRLEPNSPLWMCWCASGYREWHKAGYLEEKVKTEGRRFFIAEDETGKIRACIFADKSDVPEIKFWKDFGSFIELIDAETDNRQFYYEVLSLMEKTALKEGIEFFEFGAMDFYHTWIKAFFGNKMESFIEEENRPVMGKIWRCRVNLK